MLEKIDLTLKMGKAAYQERMRHLYPRLNLLQRMTARAGIPVIVAYEGWEASGKGTTLNQVAEWLDPRHFRVYPIFSPNADEKLRPFLWRFWLNIPSYGEWAFFDRSWYHRVLAERVEGQVKRPVWEGAFQEINAFERQLADDGYSLVKFWLHISRKEQKKRFAAMEGQKYSSWVITDEDRREHARYEQYLVALEEMFVQTSTYYAPWTIVEAMDHRHRQWKVTSTLLETVEGVLKEHAPQVFSEYLETATLIDHSLDKRDEVMEEKGKTNDPGQG
jgi:polyphosphate kinase 2 (PPK2 family)